MNARVAHAPPRNRTLLRCAVADAVLAPSTHNTQPWRFRLDRDAIELWADLDRHLHAIDPDARQLVMSCGAALYNLRLSLRAAGRRDLVAAFPDRSRPSFLARVRAGDAITISDDDRALAAAIPERRTVRTPFALRPIAADTTDRLARAAAREGAWLVRLGPAQKRALGDLVADADRRLLGSAAYRRELARWLVPAWDERRDGIPFERKEYGSTRPFAMTFRLRRGLGATFGALERARIDEAPAVIALGTDDDDPAAWLACGQALQAVLLGATAHGLAASYLNQVLEVPALRARVGPLLRPLSSPQLILRLGHAPHIPVPPVPRRPLHDVLDEP